MGIVSPSQESYALAAKKLRDGGIVCFSTETVYGVGCDTFSEPAIAKVYKLKNRPTNNPMIAHILDVSWTNQLCSGWSNKCSLLATCFWPGPLTIILPKKESVPESACGGFDTIAMRCPSHPVARALLAEFDNPISAPSANKSGHISPTTARHVEDEFGDAITIIDGGPCEKGIESTVISMVNQPTIMRLGSVSVEEIRNTIGAVEIKTSVTQQNSPGTLMRHYAPNTKTNLLNKEEMDKTSDLDCVAIAIQGNPVLTKQVFQMPSNAQEYAKVLYSTLREADNAGVSRIVIERPCTAPVWLAVIDRLERCCSD
jgi:L-threonylcarbamoyladenylate synthase